ncbi:CHAT domain-containing protein [Amycolatopsis nigrescens]|uniref:CHAT domain-containing protein n=1 Tax=Amycolatopsis nigrescens TaxID=381445 RepID=UPI0003A6252C|nr:CHAT domain-containing protein [Amycolatopsis nigrescens]
MTASRGGRPIRLVDGSPLARAVTEAGHAYRRKDVSTVDAAYRRACELAAADGGGEVWDVLAVEHSARLLELADAARALDRCEEYLAEAGPEHVELLLVRAEIHGSLGDHTAAAADAGSIRAALGDRTWSLTADSHARLLRAEGLAAADRHEFGRAGKLLGGAGRAFFSAGNETAVAAIDKDLRQIEVQRGAESAVDQALQAEQPRTAADYLRLALALKRDLRYEKAAAVLREGVDDPGVDPALHLELLCELIVLLRAIRRYGEVEALYARLAMAAQQVPDRRLAQKTLDRVQTTGLLGSTQFEHELGLARRLVDETRLNDPETKDRPRPAKCRWRLDKAEETLHRLSKQTRHGVDAITWHLAAAELELARHLLSNKEDLLTEAVKHLLTVIDRTDGTSLMEVRASALRLLGHTYYFQADARNLDDRAARCWDAAYRIEEDVAGRQETVEVRLGMLLAAPDEHDERVRAAAAAVHRRHVTAEALPEGEQEPDEWNPEAIAAVVAAMEAAKGATILGDTRRDLPRLNDLAGARRWLAEVTRDLPRSQAVWMMHATPGWVHHALLWRDGGVAYTSVPARADLLMDAIRRLRSYWSEAALDPGISDGGFERSLADIAEMIGVAHVLPGLIPPEVGRIAIVAGGDLSDIPFAGILIPKTGERVASRYALSDLPCLSARRSLQQRSRRQRGDRRLLVSPPDDQLTKAGKPPWRKRRDLLKDENATPAALRAKLAAHQHRLVRIDSHGEHAHEDSDRSSLQLAPAGPNGQVSPEELQEMDLSHCGTVVLGACESGMAQRRGRDERTGFVRSAVQAGAASVIAARWVAADPVAAVVLDRFERRVRYLPRDVALQRAQLDVLADAGGLLTGVPAHDHPARWACWTLYGDAGRQTGAGPARRLLRRILDNWRFRALSRQIHQVQGLRLVRRR